MLNRLADRVLLRASISDAAPVRAVTATAATTAHNFLVGEEVHALVESAKAGGLFKVLIEGQTFVLRLPTHAKAGDTLLLTVTARDPKLKFEMSEFPGAPAHGARLSAAARFITALLAESERLPIAATALASVPLLPQAPGNAEILATALSNALAESGMFYESHLAQWTDGNRSLASLLHEPQARLPAALPLADAPVQSSTGDTHVVTAAPELPVHRDALAIVRQQLETLDTGHVAWHGLVWNEQALEWHVKEPPVHAPAPLSDQQWQTHVSLSLPRLGSVSATLLIGKGGARIAINTDSPEVASALSAQRTALQAALHDAGIPALGITIGSDEAF